MKKFIPFILLATLACKGILPPSIGIDKLNNQMTGKPGGFHVYLTKDSILIDAISTYISKDSIVLQGAYSDKQLNDSINFKMTVNTKVTSNKLYKDRKNYVLELNTFEPAFTRERFSITKSKNFIVQDGTLNMYTGLMQDSLGISYKYLILDDPNYLDMPIGTAGYLCTIAGKRIQHYLNLCKATYKGNCSRYKLIVSIGFFNRTKIYCDCK